MDKHAKAVPLQWHPMGFVEAFTRLGADLDVLLEGTEINRAQLERGCGRISYAQQARLIRNGIDACGQPGIGLLAGLEFAWCFFGPVGDVVHCSPSLREAGEAIRRYVAIAQPGYPIVPSVGRPSGVLETTDWYVDTIGTFSHRDVDPALAAFEVEFRLATYLRVVDRCGDKSAADPSVHVRLGYPEPNHSHLYSALPCTSVTFGCPATQVVMHRDYLLGSWRPYRRAVFDQLIQRCEETLRRYHPQVSFAERVRRYVADAYNRTVGLEEIAEHLSVTPRALSRRLADEGTTFRSLVHEVRMVVTVEHLRSSRLNVEEIAELMSFSCASSLRRAIKRWTGRTAGEIRAEGALQLQDVPAVPQQVPQSLSPGPPTSVENARRSYG